MNERLAPVERLAASASFIALALLVSVSLGCGGDLGSAPCDNLCETAGYGSADENVLEDGTYSCECGGGGRDLTAEACRDYCGAIGGDAETAALISDDTCTCGGVDVSQ